MDISAYQHMNIRMSTRGKRPQRNLTPNDKVRAIQRIHNGETKASVSRDIGVPESTLRGWCKNEQKLRFMCRQLGTDQLSISVLDNPPEKRAKLENHIPIPKYANLSNYDNFGYNRLPLNGLNFACNKNAILEKIAFNEFSSTNNLHIEASRQYKGRFHMPGIHSLSVSSDYSQFAMMENLNFFSLLNPSSTGIPGLNIDRSTDGKEAKIVLRTSGSASNRKYKAKNDAESFQNTCTKEKSEELQSSNNDNNDSNNNEVQSNKLFLAEAPVADTTSIFSSLFPLPMPPILNQIDYSETNSTILLEWCKIFNASLNFFALAAAAAALQPSPIPSVKSNNENDFEWKNSENNIVVKQFKEEFYYPHVNMASEASCDTFFESEPEDLSIRSTTSKISSPNNSRSQSPVKSTGSGSTLHSDNEQ